ncbi:MAG: EAL domain-containing protein [Methyloversatilis sp.]|nr:EAL domain-containing protein [Methyloversatilis sp.]MBP6193006.1 EAL domain-containing protein [Methyloversatilis sp.]MBP9116851.1 EAL domain-containing protein [Methyloversatilis sp.]
MSDDRRMSDIIARVEREARNLFRIYDADENVAPAFRAKQIRSVLRFAPLSIFTCIFNATLIVLMFGDRTSFWVVALWLAGLVACMSGTMQAWVRQRRRPARTGLSARALRRATLHAGFFGALWAVPAFIFFDRSDADATLIIPFVTVSMLCAGGFVLANIPTASAAYIVVLSLGTCIAFMIDGPVRNLDLVLMFSLYAVLTLACCIGSARTFGAGLMTEAEAERQKELVGLLLHDFESHSSDWLWDTDRNGFLQHVSARLAEIFGRTQEELRSKPFIELFVSGDADMSDGQRDALMKLSAHLMQAVPFRDVPVAVNVSGECRWWSLTARPLFDTRGHHAGWRGVCSDITDSRRAALEMATLANFDSLTGLANRHYFRTQLSIIRPSVDDRARPCALMFFDLDDFKDVNDSLGHAAGDRVLQLVSRRLKERIGAGDLLARLGGDEFALICWGGHSPERASALADRLLEAFREPVLIDDVSVQIGCSIGIALAPLHGDDPDVLLKNADMALYAAKAAGRNTWRFFALDMDERARHRLSVHSDLLGALERGEFELHYQPQVDMRNGRVAGFEALIRWRHPQRGLVAPSDFISIAEETGLIASIGRWALERACQDAMSWPDGMTVAVNVSAVQFARGAVVDVVRAALASSGLEPSRLEIEITESLLIHDSAAARDILGALRQLGIGIALDDFGTGYSSLAYLRSFPMTKLKIDRSFVISLSRDESARAIVRAIINLAHALRLETTVEGVETPAQWTALSGEECTYAQGFLIARPLPEPRIPDFLADWRGVSLSASNDRVVGPNGRVPLTL